MCSNFLILFVTVLCTEAMYNQPGRETIFLSTPNPQDPNYSNHWQEIVNFQVNFAGLIMAQNVDNVIIFCRLPDQSGSDVCQYIRSNPVAGVQIPEDILLPSYLEDIWARDFTLAMDVLFKYNPQYLCDNYSCEGPSVQNSFKYLLSDCGLSAPASSNIVLDGGNVVYQDDRAILVDRVVANNPGKTVAQLKSELSKKLFKLSQADTSKIAFVSENFGGDTTGHADGLVSFLSHNVIAHTDLGEPKNTNLVKAIKQEFPGVSLQFVLLMSNYVEIPQLPGTEIDSACGMHVNTLVTENALYVPTFSSDPKNVNRAGQSKALDDEILAEIDNKAGGKPVVPVPVPFNVCRLGGNTRCLTWQSKSNLADELVQIAQEGGCY